MAGEDGRRKARKLARSAFHSAHNLRDQFSGHVRKPHVAAIEVVRHPLVVYSQKVEHRRVHIVISDNLIRRFIPDLIT